MSIARPTKVMVSAVITLTFLVGGAAPASADPDSLDTEPNPYSGLGCSCGETAPLGSPALMDEINRGLQEGRTVPMPGLQGLPPQGPPQPTPEVI